MYTVKARQGPTHMSSWAISEGDMQGDCDRLLAPSPDQITSSAG